MLQIKNQGQIIYYQDLIKTKREMMYLQFNSGGKF